MKLIYFGIEIEFQEASQVYTPARRVFQALGGKVEGGRPKEPGARIKIQDMQGEIIWRYDGCKIGTERIESRNECINFILNYLDIIHSAAPITETSDRNVVTYWILPTSKHNFQSLEQLYRKETIIQNKFMEGTYDSSVVLDIKINDYILHHQSGPMVIKQLSDEYIQFKHKDLPKLFIFLYTSISDKKVIKYSRKEMNQYLELAFDYCKVHSEAFNGIWEGYL